MLLDVVYNHLGPSGNYLERFGPYFTDHYRTPWGRVVNFDGAGSDEVRRFVVDNATSWLRDYHVDGLRLDAVHAIHDESATHVLEELAAEVRALEGRVGRHLVLIAESDRNDPRLLRAVEAGGYGIGCSPSWSGITSARRKARSFPPRSRRTSTSTRSAGSSRSAGTP